MQGKNAIPWPISYQLEPSLPNEEGTRGREKVPHLPRCEMRRRRSEEVDNRGGSLSGPLTPW